MIRVLAVAAAIAVQATAQAPPAIFRSGIEVVELDVSVTRGGGAGWPHFVSRTVRANL